MFDPAVEARLQLEDMKQYIVEDSITIEPQGDGKVVSVKFVVKGAGSDGCADRTPDAQMEAIFCENGWKEVGQPQLEAEEELPMWYECLNSFLMTKKAVASNFANDLAAQLQALADQQEADEQTTDA